jgi:O-antigen/teichoic acid export membrane protein
MASTLTNIGYNSIAKVLTMAVGVVTSAILARNLGADDYGVVGIAMIVIGFLGRFADIGVGAALVQRRNIDDRALETAQTLNLLLAAALTLCALLAAPFTPIIFKSQAAPMVVSVLAGSFFISTIGFLPSALLTREMRFGTLRMPMVTGTVIRGIVAVTCALTGWKYWSLVAGTLAGNLTTSVLLRVSRPAKAKWRLDPNTALQLLRFGLPLCLSGLLVFVVFNIDNFVIGSFMGTSQLGYYTIAFTWATYGCTTMYETVHSVLFPRFSQMQQSRADLAAMYYRSLRVVMFIAVMANAILFAVADGFLVTVLGKGSPRWLPSLVPLEILCVYGALRASMEPVANVIMALGRSKVLLWAILLPIIVELSFLPLVTLRWGLPGVAVLVCGAYALQWVIYGPFLQRELNVGPGKLLRLAIPASLAAVSAVVMSRAIRSNDPLSWATIILRSVTVGAVFTVVHEALTRGGMLFEIKLIMNSRIRKPNGTRAECAISPPAIRPSAM